MGGLGGWIVRSALIFEPPFFLFFSMLFTIGLGANREEERKRPLLHAYSYRPYTFTSPNSISAFCFFPPSFFLFHHVAMVRCTVLCSIISSRNFMPQGGGGGGGGYAGFFGSK